MTRGLDVAVELDVYISTIGIHTSQPARVTHGTCHTLCIQECLQRPCIESLHSKDVSSAIVHGIQRRLMVQLLGENTQFVQEMKNRIGVVQVILSMQLIQGFEPLLSRLRNIRPGFDQAG